jgi:hypothetical protein
MLLQPGANIRRPNSLGSYGDRAGDHGHVTDAQRFFDETEGHQVAAESEVLANGDMSLYSLIVQTKRSRERSAVRGP